MRYVLSLDGGGTKLDCLIANENGEFVGRGKGGPTNSYFMSAEDIDNSISSAIAQALNKLKINRNEVDIVYTAVSVENNILIKILKKHLHENVKINICSESKLSLFAAILKDNGGITQAGTGSFATVRYNSFEKTIGGWGTILGDEGSGYHIGQMALSASLKMLEGRGQPTVLKDRIFTYLKVENFKNLIDLIYPLSPGEQRKLIASLCQIVSKAAHSGDLVAKGILLEAGKKLSELTISALKLSGVSPDIEISVAGGVWKAHPIIYTKFTNEVQNQFPLIKIAKPIFEPVVGGILLGLRDLDYQVHENMDILIENFSELKFPQNFLEKNTQ